MSKEVCHHQIRFDETRRSRWGLLWTNFFLGDIREGIGPYLAIYLLSVKGWSLTEIGLVMTIFGIATVVAQVPIGEFYDITHKKRLSLILVSIAIAGSAVAIPFANSFTTIAILKGIMGLAAAFIAPGLAAMTLGLVGPKFFTLQIGRNEAFYHFGNVVISLMMGAIAYLYTTAFIFYLVPIIGLASIIALLTIKNSQIDYRLARGFTENQEKSHPYHFGALFKCRTLLLFTLAVTLWHLANQAMLPQVAERYAGQDLHLSAPFLTACIAIAQAFMIPVALFVSKKADRIGHKKIFLIGFAALPIRALLFTLSSHPLFLILSQLFDGLSGGIFGALYMVILADITRRSGRFNVSQGIASTCKNLGAALSTTLAGAIAQTLGFNLSFYVLAGIATLGFLLYLFFIPETSDPEYRREFTNDDLK